MPQRLNEPPRSSVRRALLVVASLTGLLGTAISQAEITLRVVDAAGQPLAGVIIWPDADPTSASGSATEPDHAPVGQNHPAVVDQRDKRFVPFVSLVNPGTTVAFPNSDDIRHHVYSFSEGNAFERRLYKANDAEPVQFSTPGIVALGCNIHDNMQAYVVVSERYALMTDADGRAALPAATRMMEVWHPGLQQEEQSLELRSLPGTDEQGYRLTLDYTWADPQRPRSGNQLESLLKQFSSHAR